MKKWQKKDPKNSTISERPYGRTAYDQKKSSEIIDLQGIFHKKTNFKKKSQNMRFARSFKPKNEKFYVTFAGCLEIRFFFNITKMCDLFFKLVFFAKDLENR